ncbi:hypothetical protein V6Z12_D04G062000 [Gossypium hirsutum]
MTRKRLDEPSTSKCRTSMLDGGRISRSCGGHERRLRTACNERRVEFMATLQSPTFKRGVSLVPYRYLGGRSFYAGLDNSS